MTWNIKRLIRTLLKERKGLKGNRKIVERRTYKEVVNFNEMIGYAVDPINGDKTPTTWGIIHCAKDGSHIVPVQPSDHRNYDMGYLLLSMQRALAGIIAPELRAVIVNLDQQNKKTTFCFYYDGEITDELYDLASCASTEAIAAFPPDYSSEEKITRLDFPNEIPEQNGKFAYLRKESPT